MYRASTSSPRCADGGFLCRSDNRLEDFSAAQEQLSRTDSSPLRHCLCRYPSRLSDSCIIVARTEIAQDELENHYREYSKLIPSSSIVSRFRYLGVCFSPVIKSSAAVGTRS